MSRWTVSVVFAGTLLCPWDTDSLSLGTTEGQPLIQVRDSKVCLVALIVLLDTCALGLPALDHLGAPRLDGLLSDDGVIQAAVGAFHPAAQRPVAVAQPFLRDAVEAGQLRQDIVIIRQAGGRHLVPRRAPQQHGAPEGLAICLDGQVAVAQPQDVQRHKGEVAQVAIWRRQGRRQWFRSLSCGLLWRAKMARRH